MDISYMELSDYAQECMKLFGVNGDDLVPALVEDPNEPVGVKHSHSNAFAKGTTFSEAVIKLIASTEFRQWNKDLTGSIS